MIIDLTETFLTNRLKMAQTMLAGFAGPGKAERYESEIAMINEIRRLRKCLATMREKLEAIVCTDGEDAGLIMVSDMAPTSYDPTLGCEVYKHIYFSPLGDALMDLWKLTEENDQCPT